MRAFAAARAATGIRALLAHDSYLPNPAAPVESLRARSVRELIAELERCERLGIPYLVAHPGAHCGAGEDAGLRTAARSLGEVLEACRGFTATIALENTAGQGTQIGWRFAQLGRLCAREAPISRTDASRTSCRCGSWPTWTWRRTSSRRASRMA